MSNGFNFNNIGNMFGNAVGAMQQVGKMGDQLSQIKQIISIVNGGGDPMQLISSFAQKNPKAGQMMQNLNGKSEAELRAYAENMAKSYGTSIDEVFSKIGMTPPR